MTESELTDYEAMVFEQDGSLREIVALNIDSAAWQRFVDYVLTHYPTTVRCGDEPAIFPPIAEVFAGSPDETPWLLSIDLGGPIANCQFRELTSLDVDLDPREIETRAALEHVFAFLAVVSRVTGTSAFLGAEGTWRRATSITQLRQESYFEHSPEYGLRGLVSG